MAIETHYGDPEYGDFGIDSAAIYDVQQVMQQGMKGVPTEMLLARASGQSLVPEIDTPLLRFGQSYPRIVRQEMVERLAQESVGQELYMRIITQAERAQKLGERADFLVIRGYKPTDSGQMIRLVTGLYEAHQQANEPALKAALADAFKCVSEEHPTVLEYKLRLLDRDVRSDPHNVTLLAPLFDLHVGYQAGLNDAVSDSALRLANAVREGIAKAAPKAIAIGVAGATMLPAAVAHADTHDSTNGIVSAGSAETFTPIDTLQTAPLPPSVDPRTAPATNREAAPQPTITAGRAQSVTPNMVSYGVAELPPPPATALTETAPPLPDMSGNPNSNNIGGTGLDNASSAEPTAPNNPPQIVSAPDARTTEQQLTQQNIDTMSASEQANSIAVLRGKEAKPQDPNDHLTKSLQRIEAYFRSSLEEVKAGDAKTIAIAANAWRTNVLSNADLNQLTPDQLAMIMSVEAQAGALEETGDKAGADQLRAMGAYNLEIGMLTGDEHLRQTFSDAPTPETSPVTTQVKRYELSSRQQEIINGLNLTEKQKAFLSEVVVGVMQATRNGAKVNAQVLIAQAIQENGWEGSKLSNQDNDLFGMKPSKDWTGPVVNFKTWEVYNGQRVSIDSKFEKFNSFANCIAEYARLIGDKSWYHDAVSNYKDTKLYLLGLLNDTDGNGNVLHAQGTPGSMSYATDPQYEEGILHIIDKAHLEQLTLGAYDTSRPHDLKHPSSRHEVMSSHEARIRAHVVQIALSKVGVHETPQHCDQGNPSIPGSCGPGVDQFTQGMLEYWCADFVSWVDNQADIPATGDSAHWRVPAVRSFKQIFEKKGGYHPRGTYTPQLGDAAFFSHSSHIGDVTAIKNGRVYVTSGNTADRHSSNAHAVYTWSFSIDSKAIAAYGDLSVLL